MLLAMAKLAMAARLSERRYRARGRGWHGGRLICKSAVDEEVIIRIGRAAGVVEITILIAKCFTAETGVDAGIVVGIHTPIVIQIANEAVANSDIALRDAEKS
jgi:hypothetical protein